ncbi:MAG: zinc ribbon domain-containing protein [Candidatus Njordarchaeia archaeon]
MRISLSILIGIITLVGSILLSLILMKLGIPIFFVAFFLPLIGIPIIKTDSAIKYEDLYPRFRRCPRCGAPLEGWEKFCPNCGYRLDDST